MDAPTTAISSPEVNAPAPKELKPLRYDQDKMQTMFSGSDKIASVLDKDVASRMEEALRDSTDADSERKYVANLHFLADRSNLTPAQVADNYDYYKKSFAEKAWGKDTPDDGAFYSQVGGLLTKEKEERGMMNEMQADIYQHAYSGMPIEEYSKVAGVKLPMTPGYNKDHLDVYHEVAKKIYETAQQDQARLSEPISVVSELFKQGQGSSPGVQQGFGKPSTREVAPAAYDVNQLRDHAKSLLSDLSEEDRQKVYMMAMRGLKADTSKSGSDKGALRLERGVFELAGSVSGLLHENFTYARSDAERQQKEADWASTQQKTGRKVDRELNGLFSGKVDPMSSTSAVGRFALNTAQEIPKISAMFSGPGLAVLFGAEQNRLQGMYEDRGISTEKASNMAAGGAAVSTALQFVNGKLLAGRIPGMDKWMAGLESKAARIAAYGTVEATTLTGSSVAMAETPDMIQMLTSSFDKTMPKVAKDAIWQNLKGVATPEGAMQLAVMSMIGTGMAHFKSEPFGEAFVSDANRLKAMGHTPETIAEVQAAKTLPEKLKVIEANQDNRTFGAEQKAAVEKLTYRYTVFGEEAGFSKKHIQIDEPNKGDERGTTVDPFQVSREGAPSGEDLPHGQYDVTRNEDGTWTTTNRATGEVVAQTNTPEMAAKVQADSMFGYETGLKNATAEMERAGYGMPDATETEKRAMPAAWAKAGETLSRDPEAGAKLAKQLKENPNLGLSDEQSALLLRHKVAIENSLADAADVAIDPTATPEMKKEAAQKERELSQQLLDFMDAVHRRGSEWGREGRWRQAMAKEDYTLITQERLLRTAKGGAELTPEEKTQLVARIEELKAKNAELDAHIAKLSEVKTPEQAIDSALSSRTPRKSAPPSGKVRAYLSEQADTARSRISARLEKIISKSVVEGDNTSGLLSTENLSDMAVVGADYLAKGADFAVEMVKEFGEKIKPHLDAIWKASRKEYQNTIRSNFIDRLTSDPEKNGKSRLNSVASGLARSFIEEGMKGRDAIVDAVHAELKKANPEITRREAQDAISGYGEFKPLTHDEISDQLRDIKGQLQQVSKLEDLEAGDRLSKTGVERRTPSEEEAKLAAQVKGVQKMNENKPRTYQAEPNTPKTAEEVRIESLDRQIEAIEKQLKDDAPFTKGKKQQPTSPEIKAREEQLAKLKEERQNARDRLQPKAEHEPKPEPKTPLEIVKDRLTKQIENLSNEIATRKRILKEKKSIELDEEAKRLEAQRDELKAQHEEIFGKKELTDEQRLNIWKARANARILELQDRIATGDYETAPKRAPVALDEEGHKINSDIQRLKQDLAIDRQKAIDDKKSQAQKLMDKGSRYTRAAVLSGYHTLGKLFGFSIARIAEMPAKEALGAIIRRTPGFRAVSEKANMESGAEFTGLGKFYSKLVTQGMREGWKQLTTGKSDLKAELGNPMYNNKQMHWEDYVTGNLHAAEKAPLITADFNLRLEKLLAHDIANGVDVTDPMVQAAHRKEAFEYAQRSALQESNALSKKINGDLARLEKDNPNAPQWDIYRYALSNFIKSFVTKGIVKTPLNHIRQTLEASPLGLGMGLVENVRANIRGVDKLTNAEANTIARLLKVGSVGTAMFIWGAIDATKDENDRIFGGLYDPSEKRSEKDVKFGRIRIGDHQLVLPSPILISAQLGSTFMRVSSSHLSKKDKTDKGVVAGTIAAVLALSESAPIVNPISRMSKSVQYGQTDRIIWDQVAALVPQLVQNIAIDLDSKKRAPKTFGQSIEMTIPKLRENVPLTKAQIKADRDPNTSYRK
jgi:hypothetical protein